MHHYSMPQDGAGVYLPLSTGSEVDGIWRCGRGMAIEYGRLVPLQRWLCVADAKEDIHEEYRECQERAAREAPTEWQFQLYLQTCIDRWAVQASIERDEELRQMSSQERAVVEAEGSAADAEANADAAGY